jgi:hypothetical protein
LNIEAAVVFEVNQIQTANGVAMTLQSMSITPSTTQLDLCYTLPPGAYDWWPHIEITIDGQSGLPLGGSDLPGKTDTSGFTERCLDLTFSTPFTRDAKQLVVTVDRLQVSPNEVLPDEVIQRANKRLAAQGIEVTFTFGDHGMGDIIRKPDGMEDTDVGRVVYDALSEQYTGPWNFVVELP